MAQSRNSWWWMLWPGLRQLWIDHSYPALALATGAGLLLNVLLAAQFVWTEWLSSTALLGGWLTVLCVWSVAGAVTIVSLARQRRLETAGASGDNTGPDPLAAAIDEYLQGKWYEAERMLRQQLRRQRKDVEAMLMLATLCRHTGRLDEADRRLEELAALEAAGKWEVEIAAERRLLDQRRTNDQQQTDESQPERNETPCGAPEMTRAA